MRLHVLSRQRAAPWIALLAALALGACHRPDASRVGSANQAASAATPAERMMMIEGASVRVRIEGPTTAPPILLVHGFSFSLESWDAWAADLARDHRVIRYDLSGHGLSGPDPQGQYGTQARVRQLVALMDSLGVRRAVIAGNSFGGQVAWNLAAQHPERVERLVLIDSAAFSINGVTEKPVAVPDIMRAYLLAPSPAAVAFSATAIYAHPEKLPAGRLEQMRAMIARPGNGPALVSHLEQFTLPAPEDALARIKAPTLILWGRADRVVPVDHAERIAAAIPGARTIIYDDVGHAPQEEASAQTLTDLRAFLASKP
jgi:pimeloyl-ACP methyl ester carboxylesterase